MNTRAVCLKAAVIKKHRLVQHHKGAVDKRELCRGVDKDDV